MDTVAVAVIAAIPPTLAALATWRSLYTRTNGKGPLGREQKQQGERLERIELHVRELAQWSTTHMLMQHRGDRT